MAATIALVLVLSVAGVTRVLARERDEALLGAAGRTLSTLSHDGSGLTVDEEGLLRETQEHHPQDARLEVLDWSGRSLVAVGDGPALQPLADGVCEDQGDVRVCGRALDGVVVIAGRSTRQERTNRDRLIGVSSAVALLVLALHGGLSGWIARRGLLPLVSLSSRLSALTPGDGVRLGANSGVTEIDEVARRFDELLLRIDDAMARERRFSAQASHELRTPLTVLRGELDLALREREIPAPATARALASVDAMSRLVEALLLLARAESKLPASNLELLNFCDLVREVTARHPILAEAGRRISVSAPEEALLMGDQHLLHGAVLNLLDNAYKHAPSASEVHVTVGIGVADVELRVADLGAGVAPELAERIFEPFFRGVDAQAGSAGYGLGLPFARSVARAHGGELRFAANHPRGAVFVMRLPLAPLS